jgi:toxin ParE1/3/4
MTYLVKGRARLDLKNHWRYIARDNLPAADHLLKAAEETFVLIARNPAIGSQRSFRKLAGVRSRAVKGFPNYLVFYQTQSETVAILRVLHGMRDLPKFFR